MSKFFIDRPMFAWVIALVIMLVGALSILKLPINQYPAIAPTAIDIQVTYPGASAQTVQDTVVQVIEQQLNGIDNLRYVSSDSNSDGSMTITVTFNQGTNPDIAQVQEIHYVAGGDSYLLKVRETDTKALGRLVRERIAALKGVRSTDTTIVMNTFKESARIPIDEADLIE